MRPVLGDQFLRDVQVRQTFKRLISPPWMFFGMTDFVQHAVHAEPDPDVLPLFDVDVRARFSDAWVMIAVTTGRSAPPRGGATSTSSDRPARRPRSRAPRLAVHVRELLDRLLDVGGRGDHRFARRGR